VNALGEIREADGLEEYLDALEEHGFGEVRYRTFAGGIVALHVGEVP
jgi:ubiquinone/menaquinone biosynthesis C-methylase UbiE